MTRDEFIEGVWTAHRLGIGCGHSLATRADHHRAEREIQDFIDEATAALFPESGDAPTLGGEPPVCQECNGAWSPRGCPACEGPGAQ